jgi:FKBP-type peptidyl-prolyl cis-trans isomerase SlyD
LCDDLVMKITLYSVVSLVWQLQDAQGALIDELTTPMEFLVGGEDLLPKVQATLMDQTAGFETLLHLEPEDAFGAYQAELVFFEECARFNEPLEVGMQLDGLPKGVGAQIDNLPQDVTYIVTEVYDNHVVLDGNHPLAGMALRLSLSVQKVRPASSAEIEAQTVVSDGSNESAASTYLH